MKTTVLCGNSNDSICRALTKAVRHSQYINVIDEAPAAVVEEAIEPEGTDEDAFVNENGQGISEEQVLDNLRWMYSTRNGRHGRMHLNAAGAHERGLRLT